MTEPLQILTRDQAEAAGERVTELHIQIRAASNEADQAALNAQRLTARISELKTQLHRFESALEQWARENRAQMGEAKTLAMRSVTISFRNSRPAVKFLGGWTLPKILEKLRGSPKLRENYIRIKEELDRQQILKDAQPPRCRLDVKTLRSFGVEISSEELFSVQPRLESNHQAERIS